MRNFDPDSSYVDRVKTATLEKVLQIILDLRLEEPFDNPEFNRGFSQALNLLEHQLQRLKT